MGNRTRVKVVKNKVAPPFKKAEFDIMYGKGISASGDILDLASELDIVDKAGAWYSYEGTRLGQGRENSKTYLEENTDLLKELEHKIRIHHNLIEEEASATEEPTKEPATEDDTSKETKTEKTPKKGKKTE